MSRRRASQHSAKLSPSLAGADGEGSINVASTAEVAGELR